MKVQVVWKDGMSFSGTSDSGFTVPMGASAAVGGADDGFRPMELIAIGLAGCTSMDVISILKKKREQITAFTVDVDTERADDHPRVFTKIHIHYTFRGENIKPASVERAIELSEERYCPAQAMLLKAAPITHTYEIIAD